jgi:hypothetical protein
VVKSGLVESNLPHFFYRRPVDHQVLAGGIDRFLIATLDHADSLVFIIRISLRANSEDRVVVYEIPIDSCVGLSIKFVVAACVTAT